MMEREKEHGRGLSVATAVGLTAVLGLGLGFLIEQGGKTRSPYGGFAVCDGGVTTRATKVGEPNYNPATDPQVLAKFADSHAQQYGGAPNLSQTQMACESSSNHNVLFLTTTGEEYKADYMQAEQVTTTSG